MKINDVSPKLNFEKVEDMIFIRMNIELLLNHILLFSPFEIELIHLSQLYIQCNQKEHKFSFQIRSLNPIVMKLNYKQKYVTNSTDLFYEMMSLNMKEFDVDGSRSLVFLDLTKEECHKIASNPHQFFQSWLESKIPFQKILVIESRGTIFFDEIKINKNGYDLFGLQMRSYEGFKVILKDR